jgi:hypothetical protein
LACGFPTCRAASLPLTNSTIFRVPLLADPGRTVRVNVTVDRGHLEQIDEAADARGLTRSAFLAQAAREKIVG